MSPARTSDPRATGRRAARADPRASGRARPLPPDERRAALIAATLPLVLTHGPRVTTKAIAAASGVAEGTIFRVFADKDELLDAIVAAALDPAPLLDELAAVDVGLPLHERLVGTTAILQRRLISVIRLLTAMDMHRPPGERGPGHPTNELIHDALVRIIEPDRGQFRIPPVEVVRLLWLITFSGSHPLITDGNLLTPDEIVSVLLDGVRRKP